MLKHIRTPWLFVVIVSSTCLWNDQSLPGGILNRLSKVPSILPTKSPLLYVYLSHVRRNILLRTPFFFFCNLACSLSLRWDSCMYAIRTLSLFSWDNIFDLLIGLSMPFMLSDTSFIGLLNMWLYQWLTKQIRSRSR